MKLKPFMLIFYITTDNDVIFSIFTGIFRNFLPIKLSVLSYIKGKRIKTRTVKVAQLLSYSASEICRTVNRGQKD